MQSDQAVSSNPQHVVLQYHERLYRLALLLAGDPAGAAALVERAYRELAPAAANPEGQLMRALLRHAPSARRVSPSGPQHPTPAALAALPAHERMIVGLHYLRGLSADEVERMRPPYELAPRRRTALLVGAGVAALGIASGAAIVAMRSSASAVCMTESVV